MNTLENGDSDDTNNNNVHLPSYRGGGGGNSNSKDDDDDDDDVTDEIDMDDDEDDEDDDNNGGFGHHRTTATTNANSTAAAATAAAASGPEIINDMGDFGMDDDSNGILLEPEPDSIYNANSFFDDSDEEGSGISFENPADAPAMLARFLDLEKPTISEKMVDFLLQDGVCETLIGFITCIDAGIASKKGTLQPPRPRNYDDKVAIRRSYNTMELLCSNTRPTSRFIQAKLPVIVNCLFQVFDYRSNGNFHHFRRLFESLLRFRPLEVMDLILNNHNGRPALALSMVNFLDDSPVAASLGTLLFFPLSLTVEEERKRRLYSFLESTRFLKLIVRKMGNPDDANANAASDFLIRVVDECTRVESSEVILSCMTTPGDTLVDWIFQVLFQDSPHMANAQRSSCLKVLYALLVKSAPKEYEIPVTTGNFYGATTTRAPNGIASINDTVRQLLLDRLRDLCNLLIHTGSSPVPHATQDLKFSTYEIKHGFSSMRLSLLEVIHEVLKDCDEIEEAMNKIPVQLWKLLTNWFFRYEHNNVFHALFFKIFVVVMRSNHVETIRSILSKNKFLTRIIEYYHENPTSSCRGYILLLCNYIRLTADTQTPQEYVPSMLTSHHQWQAFLPELRNDTMAQVTIPPVDPTMGFQRPLPHVGPLSQPQESEEMASFLSRILKAGEIDLGSQFAYNLGFTGSPREDDDFGTLGPSSPKKKKSKRKKRKSQVIKLDAIADDRRPPQISALLQERGRADSPRPDVPIGATFSEEPSFRGE